MSTREKVSEAEAAAMIGWTPAALRCHRLLHVAQLTAEQLSDELAAELRPVRAGPWEPNGLREELLQAGLVKPHEGEAVVFTRLGRNVGRRLREGPRDVSPPPHLPDHQGPVHYLAADVQAWLDQNPRFRDEEELLARTISHAEAAELLEIKSKTLASFRSKARKASMRIEAGQALSDDHSVADRCPPHLMCGFETRYDREVVDEWINRKGRVAYGLDPQTGAPYKGPKGPACPTMEEPVAKLRSKRSKNYKVSAGGAVTFEGR